MSEKSFPTPIGILASGRGSNCIAIGEAIEQGKIHAEIRAVISDRMDAPVLEKARAKGWEVWGIPKLPEEDIRAHEARLLEKLREAGVQWVVLAGYMRVLTPQLIEAFKSEEGYSRIVNIHPSLLPSFPGLNGYAQAFHHGVAWSGVTVHLVNEGLDSGPICAQEPFFIQDCGSVEEVEARGLKIEHRLYPETLSWLFQGAFQWEVRKGGRSCVRSR